MMSYKFYLFFPPKTLVRKRIKKLKNVYIQICIIMYLKTVVEKVLKCYFVENKLLMVLKSL